MWQDGPAVKGPKKKWTWLVTNLETWAPGKYTLARNSNDYSLLR